MDCFMARQPILDREGKAHAYELLYRKGPEGGAGPLDEADEHRAILNALVEIGLGRLAGDRPAFVNLSPAMLMSDAVGLLPPERVVLELLENTQPDEATLARIADLRAEGYRFAYDDFTFQRHQLAFVGRVDLLKVDVVETPWAFVERGAPQLLKRGVSLLAEKVEDRETHERCLALGFELFQGYYFARPETLASKGVETRQKAILKLMAVLNRPDATVAQIEEAVAQDPALAARLVKLANGAGYGGLRKIESVRMAIQMLGMGRLQAYATMLVASGATGADHRALSELGLVRARMCERLAEESGRRNPHKSFTVGLLSVLDALMAMPMTRIVEELALAPDLAAALLDPEGSEDLRVVTALERGDWAALEGLSLGGGDLTCAYASAVADTAALD